MVLGSDLPTLPSCLPHSCVTIDTAPGPPSFFRSEAQGSSAMLPWSFSPDSHCCPGSRCPALEWGVCRAPVLPLDATVPAGQGQSCLVNLGCCCSRTKPVSKAALRGETPRFLSAGVYVAHCICSSDSTCLTIMGVWNRAAVEVARRVDQISR